MLTRGRLHGLLVFALVVAVVGLLATVASAVGRFSDDDGNTHEGNIEAIAAEGITKGCNPPTNDLYCPDDPVTRGQMAAFLRRAFDLPAASQDHFVDDNGSTFEGDINALAEAGITKGCNPPDNNEYCPDGNVTRGQMAAFLRRAFSLTPSTEDHFIDDDDSIFEADINAIAKEGITTGCNPPTNDRYCPSDLVLRDQMASFLARALGLKPVTSPVGTAEQPIQLLFMPTTNIQDIVDAASVLINDLEQNTGLVYELSIPTSVGAAVETMCVEPENTIGFITGIAYAVGSDMCGIDSAFKTMRFGYGDYWSEILVRRDSTYTSLDDLENLSWAVPTKGSLSGYMVPRTMFSLAEVDPGPVVEAGGHNSAILSLYNGDTDFAAAFFSPPLIEGGDPWQEGDPPDVPDDLVSQCEPTEAGLYCDNYRVLDARASIADEAPDVVQQIRILEISPAIPNDPVAFGAEFPVNVRAKVETGLIEFDSWNDTFIDSYGWTGIEAASDSEYEFLRTLTDLFDLTLDDL